MIDYLKNKILQWTPEIANQFHNNIVRQGNNSNKIWEIDDNGFCIFSADVATLYYTDGTSYHLQFGNLTNHLRLVNKISDLADQNNLIKVVKITDIRPILIEGIEFTYWKEKTPYSSLGADFTTLLLTTKDNPVNFLKNLVVGVDQLIGIIDELNINEEIYPLKLQADNFYYDQESSQYFWRSNFLLTASRHESTDSMKVAITELTDHLNLFLKIDIPDFSEIIMSHTKNQCSILNLII
jgi:hypothetical protein